ncbi:hypothetical protein HF521_008431, partial [Silurus meridionalis]
KKHYLATHRISTGLFTLTVPAFSGTELCTSSPAQSQSFPQLQQGQRARLRSIEAKWIGSMDECSSVAVCFMRIDTSMRWRACVGFGRQVGNASIYLRLLLRPPWPVPAEKEEKEETRGATAGLRDLGLMNWD